MADQEIQIHQQISMTPAQLTKWLDNAVKNDLKESIMIWGPPGIGKSSIVGQVASDNAIDMRDVRLSQLSPTDLRGLPVPNTQTKTSEWFPPSFLPREGKGVLFLDEFNMSPPAVQGIAQQLILDRKVGDYEVPPGWLIWAAGNRKEDKAIVFDMSAPLSNRFLHLTVEPNVPSFIEYGFSRGISPLVLAFIQLRPRLMHDISLSRTSHAWPSPRSWFSANNLFLQGQSIAPAVGPTVAREFQAFLEFRTALPNVEKIARGEGQSESFPTEISAQYALMGSLIEAAILIETNPSDPKVEETSRKKMPRVINSMAWVFEQTSKIGKIEFAILILSQIQEALKREHREGYMALLLASDPRTKPFYVGDLKTGAPSLRKLLNQAEMYAAEDAARERK